MNEHLADFYTSKLDGLNDYSRSLRQRSRWLVAGELASFVLAVVAVVLFCSVEWVGSAALWTASAMLVAYVLVRRMDIKNSERIESAEDKAAVYAHELRYMQGDYSPFDTGKRYIDPKHAYTFDMDVFGPESLYNRLCRAVTSGGADRLADLLSTCAVANDKTAAGIALQREAISELSQCEKWRTDFLSLGQRQRIDTAAVRAAVDGMKRAQVSKAAHNPLSLAAAYVAVAGFWVSVGLAVFTPVSASLPLWWGVAQFTVVYALCASPLRSITKAISPLHRQMKAYVALIRLTLTLNATTEANKRLTNALRDGENDALQSFAEMERIIDELDRRGNMLGTILFNVAMLSDYFLVRRFLKWQQTYLGSFDRWIAAVSEIDAMVSLATFRYNEPTATDAEVVDVDKTLFEAEALRHPFLGAKAVGNDFTVADGNYYIVTGANMAGKSTFLRSIGINYILAMMGAPVFARRLRVSVFSLFSSMRTSDDLSHGISYFNAELLRLDQLINSCKREKHTLIILDEILKGTNSLDKLNGSRMFLNAISKLSVSGVVATHDLELSRMADERPDIFHNYCFEISLSGKITYTYRIASGVARNQNATFLLRNILSLVKD